MASNTCSMPGCHTPLQTLALANRNPDSPGDPWTAVFCPNCDRRPCEACKKPVVDGGASKCPHCKAPLDTVPATAWVCGGCGRAEQPNSEGWLQVNHLYWCPACHKKTVI